MKRFYLPKLLSRMQEATCDKTFVTQFHDLPEQDMPDVGIIAGYILSADGLKDHFYAICFLGEDKNQLVHCSEEHPLVCTTSLVKPSPFGFPTVSVSTPQL